MNSKEILAKIRKAAFGEPVAPAAAPIAPVAPVAAATTTPVATPFKLKDGTDITIGIDDPATSMSPDAGDMVTIAGAPAAAGDYVLEDGTTLTVDATGMITVVVSPQPATQPEFVAPPAKTLEERITAIEVKINAPATMSAIGSIGSLTTEAVQAMYAKFATGTTEERIGNLEVMIKALMDNSFGYQIRQGQENEAIQAYKNTILPMQTSMKAMEAKIVKQDGIIDGLFELAEKLVEEPTAAPATLTGRKKQKFEAQTAREKRLANIAEAFGKRKTQFQAQ